MDAPTITVERDDFTIRVEPARGFWLVDHRSGATSSLGLAESTSPTSPVQNPARNLYVADWPGGVHVVVNAQDRAAMAEPELLLPASGFVVAGPTFRAFHLLAGFGQRFRAPSLFVLRSLDGLPLEESTRVAVLRAFGDRVLLVANVHGQMQLGDEVVTREPDGFRVPVERELTVVFHDWYG